MNQAINQMAVIARRDFLAVVATPTFLLFLLAPFFMLAISIGSGFGGAYIAKSAASVKQIVVIASASDTQRLKLQDADLRRRLYAPGGGPPDLKFIAPMSDPAAQETLIFGNKNVETVAIMRGSLERPIITHQRDEGRQARFLSLLAEQTLRSDRLGTAPEASLSKPSISSISKPAPTKSRQQTTGSGAVVVIFILTLMLASQAVGMMAEEKSNKVLEILAAAVPLEAVFFGKLIGLFGVALMFIGFWGGLAAIGVSVVPASVGLASFAPVIGMPTFIILGAAYFTMAYMLLGAVFLGIGAQASTMREIQMLSLPITIFQMAMFGLSSAAASSPGSTVARVAEIFPFSSPFAMVARGATSAALWPHLLALAWQALWVGLTIFAAARLFRIGVLHSGGGWRGLFRRRAAKSGI